MTTPDPAVTGASPDDFLATTSEDETGKIVTEYVKLQDVSSELLFHYVTLGDERAAAELAARLGLDTDTDTTEPAPEEETP